MISNMKHKHLQDCNSHNEVRQSGISLAPIWKQNINAQGTSEVQKKTRSKDIERCKHRKYAINNLVLGQAHYTKNDCQCF